MSPPNRDLTSHAYTRQCPSDAQGQAAIGFSTPQRTSPPGRTGRRSRDFSAMCLQVAGPLPLRWTTLAGGSTQCSPHPAADAGSRPPQARRGAAPSAAAPASYRPAAGYTLLHRGQGLNRLGLGPLRNLEPKPVVQRYERQTPGDLIHGNCQER